MKQAALSAATGGMNQKTDAQIVAEVLHGNRGAYAHLVDKYKGPVFNLALGMTGNYHDAEDLAQETFIRAYEKLNLFDEDRKFFTWLYTIGINLIRNHLKKKRAETSAAKLFAHRPPRPSGGGTGGEARQDDALGLEKALLRLKPEVRQAIILKYRQGLTFEEVAEITVSSVSAVKMRIYRGLSALKGMMKE